MLTIVKVLCGLWCIQSILVILTGITCNKSYWYKSIEFGMALKKSAARFKQKAETFLITKSATWWKFGSSFWFLGKDKMRIKANL